MTGSVTIGVAWLDRLPSVHVGGHVCCGAVNCGCAGRELRVVILRWGWFVTRSVRLVIKTFSCDTWTFFLPLQQNSNVREPRVTRSSLSLFSAGLLIYNSAIIHLTKFYKVIQVIIVFYYWILTSPALISILEHFQRWHTRMTAQRAQRRCCPWQTVVLFQQSLYHRCTIVSSSFKMAERPTKKQFSQFNPLYYRSSEWHFAS